MSKHECPVVRVEIEPHPNADAIEIALVGGFRSIVKKGQFRSGDLAVYIPEQSVLPEWLLKKMGFWDELNNKGTLTSSAGNRVKAIKLRGVVSQGLLVSAPNIGGVLVLGAPGEEVPDFLGSDNLVSTVKIKEFQEGSDAAEFLGITKWEPTIPAHLAGKVAGGDLDATIGYDFENIKKNPAIFEDGMEVVFTEKIHGTLLQVGIIPQRIWVGKSWADKCPDLGNGFKCIVTSKGQGAKGLMLDPSDVGNLYVQCAMKLELWDRLNYIRDQVLGHPNDQPLFMFGEIFGIGVQDLGYGQDKPQFRAFDIYAGTRNNGFYLNDELFQLSCARAQIETVPELYRGPFSAEVLKLHTDGITTIGGVNQIREGVVVKATAQQYHPRYGRRVAKSISDAYLLRKSANATEYQ